jgi:hypothetical protein
MGGAASSLLTFDDSKQPTHSSAVKATSAAIGGAAATSAGVAYATVAVTAASGAFHAQAQSSLFTGQLIRSVTAIATGVVSGTGEGQSGARIGGTLRAALAGAQSVALAVAAPAASTTSTVLSANSKIAAAFGSSPSYFAIADMAGGHGGSSTASQVATSEIDETVDLTKLTARQDLVIGFYSGAVTGGGVTGVTFDLFADGHDVLHEAFASGAAAQAWFTNNAVDLGSLASGQTLGANTLALRAVMTVTTDAAGSAFTGNIIVGDPPPARATPGAALPLVSAMASFDYRAGISCGETWRAPVRMTSLLVRAA